MYELSTNVANPKQLRQGDYSSYDALYLGDFSCLDYPNNFSAHADLLDDAVGRVKDAGQRCYLRIYATPGNEDLPAVRAHLEKAMTLPVDGLEVHNLGVLRMLRQMECTLPVHLGVFGNLYTDATARILKDYGVERVYPNPELSLSEILYIREQADVEIAMPVHGKIPLVISETCFIMEHASCGKRNGDGRCNFPCNEEFWLNRSQGEWVLKDTGRMTLSGKDLCMLEHLPQLVAGGLRHFYVQSHGESSDYVARVGAIYRAALDRLAAGETPDSSAQPLAELQGLAREGLCNGYFFEGAGQTYVGRSES